ncbi:hypothetical protein Tco_0606644 [Tanacetum coccineum]
MLHKSGRIDEDVSNRIKAAWMKWRAATGVLCDRIVPFKLKGKFYRVAIRPAMLYGSECWPITKALANRVEVAELRMLRWTCGKTLRDMIPNGVYRAQLEVETIINKMREGRLRWFGHVRRRSQSAPVRRVEDSRRPEEKGIAWRARIRYVVSTSRYVVSTGRVVVPTVRYVVPAGKVIIIVSPGRLSLVPTGRELSPGRVK